MSEIIHGSLGNISMDVGASLSLSSAQHALDVRDWVSAEKAARRAIDAEPGNAAGHRMLAVALSHMGRHEEAISSVRVSMSLSIEAKNYSVLGMVYFHAADIVMAVASFKTALKIDPDFAEAAVNLSALYLTQHRFADAWPLWLARFATDDAPSSPVLSVQSMPGIMAADSVPIWDGKPYPGKTLLVWGEQGLGDQILFSSILRDLSKLRMNVALVCERRLLPLFSRSFPWLIVVAAGSRAMPQHDYQILMGELGRFFRGSVGKFAGRGGLLKASAVKTREFRKRMALPGPRKVIGVSWHSARREDGAEKSLSVEQLGALISRQEFCWLNLQYGPEGDKMIPGLSTDISVSATSDIDGLAAQIAGLDLLITVSNVTAHIGAALGVETWLLEPLGKGSRWYWGTKDYPSPWYPGVRAFHQAVPGEWGPVLEEVGTALGVWHGR